MTTERDAAEAAPSAPRHKRGPLLPVIVVPLIFAFMLLTFAWPAARAEPRDLPLGLAGPAAATRTVENRLSGEGDAYELHRYADEQAARDAIEGREVYGAFVASGTGLTLLTASAASPVVAGMLENAARSATPEPTVGASAQVQTEDVVPADSNDPRGSVLNSLVLPLVLCGVMTAVLLTLRSRPGLKQVGALFATTAVAGVVGIAMVQSWLGALGGAWLVNAGVLCLTMLAIAAFLAGLAALFGHVGLALGAVTMVLFANPWSGISSAPELLPKPIGLIGQLMPPGAGGNLLRSTAFFDGGGASAHLAVLFVWAAVGLLALWAGALVRRRRVPTLVLEPLLPRAG